MLYTRSTKHNIHILKWLPKSVVCHTTGNQFVAILNLFLGSTYHVFGAVPQPRKGIDAIYCVGEVYVCEWFLAFFMNQQH